MIHQDISFHCSTPIQRNDGTMPKTEQNTERQSLKAIASKALQRNAPRNGSGTVKTENDESFREISSFHAEIEGKYTPYVCGITTAHVDELHALIHRFIKIYDVSESETKRIIAAAKCQALATVPESIQYFKNEIQNHSMKRN